MAKREDFEWWLKHYLPPVMLAGYWRHEKIKGELVRTWIYNDVPVNMMWLSYQRGFKDATTNDE